MKKIITISCLFLLLLSTGGEIYSQPATQWIQRYNGLLDTTDVAKDIVVDNLGNTYITGHSVTLLGLFNQIVTIKYDPNGNQLWEREYGGILQDEGTAIILDNTQQYIYVAGFTNGVLNLTADYVIIKYDVSGNQIWNRIYDNGLLGDDRATSIAVDGQNNPVITGYSSGPIILSPHDYATVKYDQNGNQQWVQRYNGPGNSEDRSYAIVVDNSDNVIVTGQSRKGLLVFSDDDFATVKYNSSGVQQWDAIYNGPGGNNEDRSYAIVVDNSDNVVVTGESQSSSAPNSEDYATIKYNSAGSQQWVSRYNGPGNNYDRSYAIVVDNSDNIIVTGESTGSGTDLDYATVKYNPAGAQQWAPRYNGPGNSEDRSYAIVVDNSDNVYVTGSSRSTGSAGSEDYATLKYNPAGAQQWPALRYDGSGNNFDRSYAIVVDNSGNIYITGESRNGALIGSEDYLTIKYNDEKSTVSVISNEIPVTNSLKQNYPNPFNPSTNIRFDVAFQTFVNITIYNIRGERLSVIVNERLSPGKYQVLWNASNFSSGIYLYKVTTDGFSETKKMLLVK